MAPAAPLAASRSDATLPSDTGDTLAGGLPSAPPPVLREEDFRSEASPFMPTPLTRLTLYDGGGAELMSCLTARSVRRCDHFYLPSETRQTDGEGARTHWH